MGNWSRASASAGRGAGEERWVPVTDGGAVFAGRGWRAEWNQDDEGGGGGDRSYRVEDDAERAVVGVGLEGVGVRDLDDGQQGQQDEAKGRRRHDHTGPGEEGFAPGWLESTQN